MKERDKNSSRKEVNMIDHTYMSRVSILEANDQHNQKHRDSVDKAVVDISKDIRDIRDVIIGSNLSELPKRISNLERWQWIRTGAVSILSIVFTLLINWIAKGVH